MKVKAWGLAVLVAAVAGCGTETTDVSQGVASLNKDLAGERGARLPEGDRGRRGHGVHLHPHEHAQRQEHQGPVEGQQAGREPGGHRGQRAGLPARARARRRGLATIRLRSLPPFSRRPPAGIPVVLCRGGSGWLLLCSCWHSPRPRRPIITTRTWTGPRRCRRWRSAEVQPKPVKNCRKASIRCADDLLRRLRAQWRPLDAACDHRALWPFAYIQITKLIRADLARAEPRWFPHAKWFIYVITDFSNRYFQAFANYDGRPERVPYVVADDLRRGRARRLPRRPGHPAREQRAHPVRPAARLREARDAHARGRVAQADHDGVNEVNTRVFDFSRTSTRERYDPTFEWVDMKPSPVDEIGSLEMVKGWREGAWRNAERLMNARTPEERSEVERSIELNARVGPSRSARPSSRATARCATSTAVAARPARTGPSRTRRGWTPRRSPSLSASCSTRGRPSRPPDRRPAGARRSRRPGRSPPPAGGRGGNDLQAHGPSPPYFTALVTSSLTTGAPLRHARR